MPDSAPEQVAAADVAPDSAPEPVAAADTAPPPTPISHLTLTSEPTGAEVSEGERVLGRTPLTVELPAGRHTLALRAKGYEPDELTLDLLADGAVTQAIELDRAGGPVVHRRRPAASAVAAPTTGPTAPAVVTPPVETAPVTATEAEPPRPRLLGTETRPRLLGQDPPAPAIKVLGTPNP
ncbi:MAG: PEGA domain-containing protein [Myxococcota bacterium]